ncbi:MAG: hypothetical protein ETSY1_08970 [Candidatus Entotheonella factor]|uniref:Sulfatase-modifying factor enzyme-like domain-containing protein n=1 Tax=Entotheonella factor TaxID=1429438 RepID=W4LT53_ENTF1|nr:SUMF1/EgtB/PvdO family nonheme iron enzyme [Candidatus Entotheonella palauensis]ETX01045.1 MAG: hypothetical protein ETSY1_08970 [Candidatus Entotheonella factor]
MRTPPNDKTSGLATTLLPARWVRGLGGVLLAVGLILPWLIIKARTQQVAQHLTTTSQETGPLRPEMVLLPASRDVSVAISATEVTQGQYRRVMGELPGGKCELPKQGENFPVSCVTRADAATFCNLLSDKEGLAPCYVTDRRGVWQTMPACEGYRLPTTLEWEYAAMAETHQRYAGTDDDAAVCEYANVRDDFAVYACHDGFTAVAPVKQYKPNAWFLYDMTGNVAEWTDNHTVRGGSWLSIIETTRLDTPMPTPPPSAPDLGFRIVRSPTASERRDLVQDSR